jgi:hypothetical protein
MLVGLGPALVAVGFGLNCAPSEDTSVTRVTNCDVNTLNTADPAESTVKLYVETAGELRDRAKLLVERFKTVCNKMNRDLGDNEGAEVRAACNNLADRIAKASVRAPFPDGGLSRPIWVTVSFDATTCVKDSQTEARCLEGCSLKPGCDSINTCAKGKVTGTCPGTCASRCQTAGDNVACNGACRGSCTSPDPDGGPEGGVPACAGECRGTCKSASWLGRCSTGCTAGFVGECRGTCIGSCDGVAFAGDGGTFDAGDGGDGGLIPGSGTCAGNCTGRCVGEASGSCTARCTGDFSGGACTGVGNCVGACNGPNLPCVTECSGTCVTKEGTACSGTCTDCDQPMQKANCEGAFECGDANSLCKSVCAVKGSLSAKCETVPVDIRIAGDFKLYDALKANMAEFAAVARETAVLQANVAGVLNQTTSKFKEIGVVYDNARLCATGAAPIYEEARSLLNDATGAQLILSGVKF